MNILYAFAFFIVIYYIIQWKNITNKLKNKLQNQHNKINKQIQDRLAANDSRLIEGFTQPTAISNIFNNLIVKNTDERNNCNTMFIPTSYGEIYSNEITEDLFNYTTMKKEVNL